MKRRPALALAMMVKNEEANLARCLDSVAHLVDELVIVDTGSTDRTKEIAASYADAAPGVEGPDGARGAGLTLLDFAWCDDFSAPRNFALDHVSADWVLQLDGDEELAGGAEFLPDLLRDKYIWAYQTIILVAPDLEHLELSLEKQTAVRLYRNRAKLRFQGVIHEHIPIDEADRTGMSDVVINHFGPHLADFKSRIGRNVPLLIDELEKDPTNARLFMLLAQEWFTAQNWTEAKYAFEKVIELGKPLTVYHAAAMRHIIACDLELGDLKRAWKLAGEMLAMYPLYTDLVFLQGKIAFRAGDLDRAEKAMRSCLEMGDPPAGYWTWGGVAGWRATKALEEIAEARAEKR